MDSRYITLVNSTNTSFEKTHESSNLMNVWAFPEIIEPGSSEDIHAEWGYQGCRYFGDQKGTVVYTLNDERKSKFKVRATTTHTGTHNAEIYFSTLATKYTTRGSTIPLQWDQNGQAAFVLSGTEGMYTSTNLDGSRWMQDNLDLLEDKLLGNICIPGSRDAGMNVTSGFNVRSDGIKRQLEYGVRFFDFTAVISGQKYMVTSGLPTHGRK